MGRRSKESDLLCLKCTRAECKGWHKDCDYALKHGTNATESLRQDYCGFAEPWADHRIGLEKGRLRRERVRKST